MLWKKECKREGRDRSKSAFYLCFVFFFFQSDYYWSVRNTRSMLKPESSIIRFSSPAFVGLAVYEVVTLFLIYTSSTSLLSFYICLWTRNLQSLSERGGSGPHSEHDSWADDVSPLTLFLFQILWLSKSYNILRKQFWGLCLDCKN